MTQSMTLAVIIKRAEERILAHARRIDSTARVFSFGAVDIDPKHFAIWIATDKDQSRDRLNGDPAFKQQIRQILHEVGYPEAAIPEIGIAFESQETVDRDYEGSWWYAVK